MSQPNTSPAVAGTKAKPIYAADGRRWTSIGHAARELKTCRSNVFHHLSAGVPVVVKGVLLSRTPFPVFPVVVPPAVARLPKMLSEHQRSVFTMLVTDYDIELAKLMAGHGSIDATVEAAKQVARYLIRQARIATFPQPKGETHAAA